MLNLQQKFDFYLSQLKSQQDAAGFIYSDECDSLLFSGLVGSVPKTNIDISKAQDPKSGQWFRRPTFLEPCYDCSQPWSFWSRICEIWKAVDLKSLSKSSYRQTFAAQAQAIFEQGGSSISRDMFVGMAFYCWFNKRLDLSESVVKYALKHLCIMGQGTPTRTLLTPGLLATFAEISYCLGGPNRWWLRKIPQSEDPSLVGFEAHLSVLHILLRRYLTGENPFRDVLWKQYVRQPTNPLFAFAADVISGARNILLMPSLWPEDRLPTNRDRSCNWLLERDMGTDWQPDTTSPTTTVFSGGDFLFTAWLILEKQGF